MKIYTYTPPKFKQSTAKVEVLNEQGEVVYYYNRVFKNFIVRLTEYLFNFNWYVEFDVYSTTDDLLYQCKKTTKWIGHPVYHVINCKTNEVYDIRYVTWQNVAPKFQIKGPSIEIKLEKEIMDWARFYYEGKEVAKWKWNGAGLFKSQLEIEEESPIQDAAFFVGLLQSIFFVGD